MRTGYIGPGKQPQRDYSAMTARNPPFFSWGRPLRAQPNWSPRDPAAATAPPCFPSAKGTARIQAEALGVFRDFARRPLSYG